MKRVSYHWSLDEGAEAVPSIVDWLAERNLPDFLAPLLNQRGIQTPTQLTNFFEPTPALIHDPYLLYDMEKAVNRIQEGIATGQKMVIYGDYDADGITSATVLKEAIETVGGEVSVYLPNRFNDGYGPNKHVYQELIETEGVELIITVDNGVSGHEAIAYAQSMGVDVVVTDHHELPEELPDAFAIVHPRHPQGQYPFGELAGVGVAFKVATALLEELPEEMLDLVAIGTIADLVPLKDENRVLVTYGLEVMKQGQRVGLNALLRAADITPRDVTEESVGFGIGPRLNALGRLGEAAPGVRLLSCFDEEEAREIADEVNVINQERQSIVKTISQEALTMVGELGDQAIYVLAKEGWHEGVLGIVASRIVQETGKPALVLGINHETGIAKGSGRSIEQINLYEALASASELFTSFGGHQMAAGMSLPVSHLADLQQELNAYVASLNIDLSKGPVLKVDGKLPLSQIDIAHIETLRLLAPFGTENPAPLFLLEEMLPKDVKQIGGDKTHLKFSVADGSNQVDCLAFNFGAEATELATAERVSVVGELAINEWNGNKKPQLMVKDFAIPGLQVLDKRGQQLDIRSLDLADTLVVFAKENTLKKVKLEQAASCLLTDVPPSGEWTAVVFAECPTEATQLSAFYHQVDPKKIYLYLESKEEAYLNGMPSRAQFAQLFKFIATYESVDVRHKIKDISQFLKIKTSVLIFMIQVFSELGFVTIEDGLMSKVETPENHPLETSACYQAREQKMITEKFLLFSKISEIKEWLLSEEATS